MKKLLLTLLVIGYTSLWIQGNPNEKSLKVTDLPNGKDHKQGGKLTIQLDSIGKAVRYVDEESRKYVEKYTGKTRLKKNGKLVPNPNYNEAFTQIIHRLTQADLLFQFQFNPATEQGKGGYIRYDGEKITIVFGDAGLAYGGGTDHILFEETKHAEQVLDGQVYFVDDDRDGVWGVVSSIQAEVDAKLFVIDQLGYSMTYLDGTSKLDFPTQLGMLAKKRDDPQAMRCFLKYGENNITVLGEFTVNIPGAYPDFSMVPLIYYQKKIRTDTLLTYPYQKN